MRALAHRVHGRLSLAGYMRIVEWGASMQPSHPTFALVTRGAPAGGWEVYSKPQPVGATRTMHGTCMVVGRSHAVLLTQSSPSLPPWRLLWSFSSLGAQMRHERPVTTRRNSVSRVRLRVLTWFTQYCDHHPSKVQRKTPGPPCIAVVHGREPSQADRSLAYCAWYHRHHLRPHMSCFHFHSYRSLLHRFQTSICHRIWP